MKEHHRATPRVPIKNVRSRLIAQAPRPTMAEVFERIERERAGGSAEPADVVAFLREDRDRH